MTLPLASRLNGKTVIVVGAGGNLGPVWVRALLAEGAHVIAVGLDASRDSSLTKLIGADTDLLEIADLDISDPDGVDAKALVGGHGLGSINGVVLNAGIDSIPGTGKEALADYSFLDWQQVFDVNVFGHVKFLFERASLTSQLSSYVAENYCIALRSNTGSPLTNQFQTPTKIEKTLGAL